MNVKTCPSQQRILEKYEWKLLPRIAFHGLRIQRETRRKMGCYFFDDLRLRSSVTQKPFLNEKRWLHLARVNSTVEVHSYF